MKLRLTLGEYLAKTGNDGISQQTADKIIQRAIKITKDERQEQRFRKVRNEMLPIFFRNILKKAVHEESAG